MGNSYHYNQLLLPKDGDLKVSETVHFESVSVLNLLVKVILFFFGASVVILVEFSETLLSEQVVISEVGASRLGKAKINICILVFIITFLRCKLSTIIELDLFHFLHLSLFRNEDGLAGSTLCPFLASDAQFSKLQIVTGFLFLLFRLFCEVH